MTGFHSKQKMSADKVQEPWNEEGWRRNNWRCGHGWLRGEQCEICNAPKREWVGLTDEEIHGTDGYDGTRETYQFALALIAKLKERNS
jgi:hypothetical protein